MEKQEKLYLLRTQVRDKIGRPINVHAVMATLESFGMRDHEAKEEYDEKSLFTLSTIIFKALDDEPMEESESVSNFHETIAFSDYSFGKAKILTRFYIVGLAHMIPVFIQISCVIFFGYSLWVNVGFNQLQSTAVVLGVISALILTGGYVQMIGRVGSFYWYADKRIKSFLVMNKLKRKGLKFNIIVFSIIMIVNFFLYLYPFSVIAIIWVYSFFISLLLLQFATMYPTNHRWVILLAVATATSTGLFLRFQTTINVFLTHWIAINVANVIVYSFYLKIFRKEYGHKGTYDRLIRDEVLVYNNYPYFIYGMLLYVHVFMDRILAWSAEREVSPPYVIYYEQNYEIGMDIGIIIFFLTAGVLEYSISLFSLLIATIGKKINLFDLKRFKNTFIRMYYKNILVLLITAFVAFLFLYSFTQGEWGFKTAFGEKLSKVSYTVFKISSIGYFILTWAMLNVLYMFRMNQPKYAVRCLLLGVGVNFIVGLTSSRIISYEYSVFGLVVGSFAFLLGTFIYNFKLFKKVEYYANL